METQTLEHRPGYQAWIRGANRGQMQGANRQAGLPCYCAAIWSGYCDCCTGLAGDNRCQEQLREQAE